MLNCLIKKIKIAYWISFYWINSNGYYGSNGCLIRSMVEKKMSIEVWESVKLPILSLWIVTRGYSIIAPRSKRMLLCVGI